LFDYDEERETENHLTMTPSSPSNHAISYGRMDKMMFLFPALLGLIPEEIMTLPVCLRFAK